MKMLKTISLWLCLPFSAVADEISLHADPWCPYNCQPGPQPGYMIELAQKIFSKAGHRVNYQLTAWTRAKKQLTEGKISAVVGMSLSKSNASKWVFPAQNLGVEQYCFYTKHGASWRYQNIDSLSEISLGIIKSYGYGEVLDSYIKANRSTDKITAISEDSGILRNLKMASLGRIDATIGNKVVVEQVIKQNSLSGQIQQSGCKKDPRPLFIVFSLVDPKAQEYAELLSEGIRAMRASGELQTILDKYGIADWQ